MPKETINSICLVRLSALGDVMMFVPLVRTLQNAFRNAKITWVISKPGYDLVADIPGIEFIVIDKPKSLKDYWHFKQQMKGKRFDVLLAAQASFRANLLYPCIRAKRKIGYDKQRANDGHRWFVQDSITPGRDHTVDGFLKFATAIGVAEPTIAWDLPLEPLHIDWAQTCRKDAKKPLLLVNPVASKLERTWLVDRYITVIQHAIKRWDAQVILIGGPAEQDRSIGDQILAKVDVDDWIGKTKPKQLLALLKEADLLLCPDTGPAHMSNAVGTPVVALHAVSPCGQSGPYCYQDWCVDRYDEAIQTVFNKTASAVPWGTRARSPDTMALIRVEQVIDKLDEAFGRVL